MRSRFRPGLWSRCSLFECRIVSINSFLWSIAFIFFYIQIQRHIEIQIQIQLTYLECWMASINSRCKSIAFNLLLYSKTKTFRNTNTKTKTYRNTNTARLSRVLNGLNQFLLQVNRIGLLWRFVHQMLLNYCLVKRLFNNTAIWAKTVGPLDHWCSIVSSTLLYYISQVIWVLK